MNPRELAYYSAPGPVTDLTPCPPAALEGLPIRVADLMRVVRGCVIDPGTLTQIYGLPIPSGREDEARTRTVANAIDCILRLDPEPLVSPRPPERRLLGTCRNYATLACALLRYTGTPARVRAGFAGYFVPDTWADHWIIEYWRASDERWVRLDPELDDRWLAKRQPGMTSELLAERMYLSGCETWLRCRRGELDPARCNMGGVNWGIGEVRGSVLMDVAAVNNAEVLPWDSWGMMQAAYKSETEDSYDEFLDRVSETVTSGGFEEIRDLYESEDCLRVPASLVGVGV